jgi:hypothetical protein
MLDADEKAFEKEIIFSEKHQHLAMAASGLSWGSDDSVLSGYLGGEDKPENMELSIGAYMATRTERLGSLGDPTVLRVRFLFVSTGIIFSSLIQPTCLAHPTP